VVLPVKISLIGRVRIELDGGVIDESQLAGRQGRLLFAYLVAEHGRPVPRDELAEALWGETPPVTWEKALSVLASKLRRLLAQHGAADPSLLTAAFGCYRLELPEGTWVDVLAAADASEEAEKALGDGDFDRARERASVATSLLQRPFLPGEDGTWVEAKRRDLADIHETALATLADANVRAGDAAAAVDAAEQLITFAPLRESGYRRLMEAHAAAGNRAEALAVYERCRRLLADELGAYPSPETESLYRGLLALPAGPGEPSPLEQVPVPQPAQPRRSGRKPILAIAALVLAVSAAAFTLSGAEGTELPKLQTIASARCSTLHYEGPGSPQLLIAADLPLQPGWLETTTPMVNAITLALERREYTAGSYRVGLQVCENAPRGNPNEQEVCEENAHAYAASRSVVGVVGPLTSDCAGFEIPILNRAPRGPVAIVSPSASYVGLTRSTHAWTREEPNVYYPTGRRNFVRTIPTDDVQAAAGALVARDLGVRRVYALDVDDPPSVQFVHHFLRAARTLGVSTVGRGSWDFEPASAAGIADGIAKTGADGVFLGVPSVPSSVALLTALRARLGPDVRLMAPEVFDSETALLAGAASDGMTITQPGPSPDDLPAEGKEFVAAYTARFGEKPTRYALGAAQATAVILDAIARSNGSRGSVTRNLFRTRVSNGILGSFLITPTGDTTLNAVAVYRIADGRVKTTSTVVVPDALVSP
jgi:DNA-binding SARP family transcriptional activator/ABC-type branched-subunit amino acid transport system substrate-binding protein